MILKRFFEFLYAAVRKDILRKIIAVFFAILVYFSVKEKLAEEVKISGVPVNIILPAELLDVDNKQHFVSVICSGSRRAISNIAPADLRALVRVEYGNFVDGEPYKLVLKPDDFRSENGVRVVALDNKDKELLLNLQAKGKRNVQIRAKFNSLENLTRDYEVVGVKYIPSEVELVGPKNIIKEIMAVSTEPIPLDSSVSEPFEYAVKLEPPAGMKVLPERVIVQIDIGKRFSSRVFTAVPVMMLHLPEQDNLRYEFTGPSRVEVMVKGTPQLLTGLSENEIKPYIDVSKLSQAGVYNCMVKCYVNGTGIEVTSVYPDQIPLKVTK